MVSIEALYRARTPGSAALAAAAGEFLPSGIATDTRYFDPYGLYIERAAGTRKYDVDGNAYVDFFGGHGALMLGHAHPDVLAAVLRAAGNGTQFAANHPLEVGWARRICAMVPTAERVRFTGSGTEATLLAIRLARAFTGRSLIVRVAGHYHGWHDHAVSGYVSHFDGSPAPGVLPGVASGTILVRPDDHEAWSWLTGSGADIAAVIAEPLGTHFGVVPYPQERLTNIQAFCRRIGALFILDEVLSGFRVAPGGAQAEFGLEPDLSTFAKAMAGGYPGGAVAGRADILDLMSFDEAARGGRPRVLHQGTFTGNPVSAAAGIATLDILRDGQACARANSLGGAARAALNRVFEEEGIPWACYGEFSVFHIFTNPWRRSFEPTSFDPALPTFEEYLGNTGTCLRLLRMALNVQGVDVNARCSGLLSAVHTQDDIELLAAAFRWAVTQLRAEGCFRD